MYHIFVCRLSFSHGELLSESDPKEPKSARFVFILSELFHYNTDCQFQRSHLVSGHGARVRYLLGTNVNTAFFQVPTLEFRQGAGARVQGRDLVLGHKSGHRVPVCKQCL